MSNVGYVVYCVYHTHVAISLAEMTFTCKSRSSALTLSDRSCRAINVAYNSVLVSCIVCDILAPFVEITLFSYPTSERCPSNFRQRIKVNLTGEVNSGGATPGRARSNDLAGRSTALAPPFLLLCFASVIVWTENKNLTYIWPLTASFVLFWQWNNLSSVGGLCVLKATTKTKKKEKRSSIFWWKKCIRVTWFEDVLTSKWPGSFAALAPPLEANDYSSD